MRVLSLFSGAGGADLALEAAGMSVAALCEIEPHARAVLREHWPNVPLHGDVAQLDGTAYRGKVDVVVGGSPCQDLSVAGKRAGLAEGSGTRSSLFYEQVRIWQQADAPYLIWENVKGAFSSSKGADFAAVLSALVGAPVAVPRDGWANAGVVCGPTAVAAWRLLDLQHFGVPQRRERIVVLASRAGGVDPAEVLALGQSLSRDTAPRFQAREGTATDAVGGVGGARGDTLTANYGKQIDSRDSSKGPPNLIVAAIDAEHNPANNGVMGTLNIGSSSGGGHQPVAVSFAPSVSHTLSAVGCDASEDGTGRGTPIAVQAVIPILEATSRQGKSTEGSVGIGKDGDPMFTLSTKQHGVFAVNISDARASLDDLMGTLGARSGGQEVGAQTRGVVLELNEAPPRTLAFKIRGGVEVDANGNSAGKGYLGSEELAFTLGTSQDQHIHQPVAPTLTMGAHPAAPGLNGQDAAQFAEAVLAAQPGIPRRLMPIECEALMGWPRNWTRYGVNEKGVRYELADTPRYKLCGNGIGREWMEWIGLRLLQAERG